MCLGFYKESQKSKFSKFWTFKILKLKKNLLSVWNSNFCNWVSTEKNFRKPLGLIIFRFRCSFRNVWIGTILETALLIIFRFRCSFRNVWIGTILETAPGNRLQIKVTTGGLVRALCTYSLIFCTVEKNSRKLLFVMKIQLSFSLPVHCMMPVNRLS